MSSDASQSGIVHTRVTLRYSDMDVLGHLNNAVYATLFEAGRVALVEERLMALTPPGAGYVIVKLTIEFKAEARYPGMADIQTRISRVGGSSLTFLQELRVNDRLVATAESICALFDLTRRRAMRCPDPMRSALVEQGATA